MMWVFSTLILLSGISSSLGGNGNLPSLSSITVTVLKKQHRHRDRKKMSDYVPQEVWMDIFKRLPVKTLVQIRSVCKFFHAIISSPSFISDHINSTKNHCIPVVRYFTGRKVSKKKEHYLLLPNMQEIDFPFKSESFRDFEIVGSSNGLLCLSHSLLRLYDDGKSKWSSTFPHDIIFWNPSIKKYLNLPKTQAVNLRSSNIFSVVLGFGFDCKTDDYKVVKIAYSKDYKMGPEIEAFSLKSGTWSNFNAVVPRIRSNMSQAFVEGCVHWLGLSNNAKNNNESLIVSFDMSNEEFKEVNLPDDLHQLTTPLNLSVFGEKLAAIQYSDELQHTFTVWVMEEYGVVESWSKMYDVHIPGQYLKFVGFMNDGETLVELTYHRQMALYDPNDMSVRHCIFGPGSYHSFHMEMYMESLVLLNEGSATLQSEAITYGGEAC